LCPFFSGAKSIAIPSTVKGLYSAWTVHGSLPWSTLVRPAVDLAKNGVPASALLVSYVQDKYSDFLRSPDLMNLFFRNGKPITVGAKFSNTALAATLALIANDPENWMSSNYMQDLQQQNLLNLFINSKPEFQQQVHCLLLLLLLRYELIFGIPGYASICIVCGIQRKHNLCSFMSFVWWHQFNWG
jgi:hypothetical protein